MHLLMSINVASCLLPSGSARASDPGIPAAATPAAAAIPPFRNTLREICFSIQPPDKILNSNKIICALLKICL
jgi:hypothetical protein